MKRTIAICVVLALAGCAGSGQEPPEATLAYTSAVASPHTYTPHQWSSHTSLWNRGDVVEVFIGGDLEPRESLRHVVTTDNGIRYFMGASRDGVGVNRLEKYAEDLSTQNGADPYGFGGDGFKPFLLQPHLYFDPDLLLPENEGIAWALYDSVTILNDALPPEFQIVVAGTRLADVAYSGEIVVVLESPQSAYWACGSTAVACARNFFTPDLHYTRSAFVNLPDDFDTSEYMFPRKVIIHELLHALGIQGHVDSVEFPDSIMGGHGEYIPNLGHVISKIDREVLQIMYMSQLTEIYNDWGEWSDTTFHLVGRSEDEALNFGVALFNGLPQPWVRGVLPEADLADNRRLYGTATWNGSLLGYAGATPIAGDAELQVRLSTLAHSDNEQDLRFRDIFYLNRFESEGPERWFHTRDIDYKVMVTGNGFWNVDGDGWVTGAFMGPEHEHMGGTVKRTDMVAAFGGSR